ncbi:hypothetical protein CRUP_026310 [Coryphaenoides rupestris]|nr:hypothetical protein CRUP_026310 [Coryphaenoides rupestris]
MVGETEVKERPRSSPDYLMQLMNDRKVMSSLPNFSGIFTHLERLLDEEIGRVRKDMYNDTLSGGGPLDGRDCEELPDAVGPVAQLQEKLYVPVKEYPDVSGQTPPHYPPRGDQQLADLRGGSLQFDLGPVVRVLHRDQNVEVFAELADLRGGSLQFDLGPVVRVLHRDQNVEVFAEAEGEDSLKKMQLMELAILNGTYRDANLKTRKNDIIADTGGGAATMAFSLASPQAPRILTGPMPVLPPALRNPSPMSGPTLMPLIRQIQSSALMQGGSPHPALMQQGPESGIIYTPYEYPYTLTPSILECHDRKGPSPRHENPPVPKGYDHRQSGPPPPGHAPRQPT